MQFCESLKLSLPCVNMPVIDERQTPRVTAGLHLPVFLLITTIFIRKYKFWLTIIIKPIFLFSIYRKLYMQKNSNWIQREQYLLNYINNSKPFIWIIQVHSFIAAWSKKKSCSQLSSYAFSKITQYYTLLTLLTWVTITTIQNVLD